MKRDSSHLEPTDLPRLPQLSGDTLLRVFTHRSLRDPDPTREPLDNARLTILGDHYLQLVISDVLMDVRPILDREELMSMRDFFMSADVVADLAAKCELVKHVRCLPDKYAEMSSPEESAALFRAYMGGAFADWGDASGVREFVRRWIQSHGLDTDGAAVEQRASKRIKMESSDDGGVIQAVGVVYPDPVFTRAAVSNPPTSSPLNAATSAPGLMSSSTSSKLPVVSLMAFNQAAAQRKIQVEYLDEWVDGKWVVSCVLNGTKKGSGSGQNKRTAKEEAVRDAHAQLGWYL
ncbi:unnamed protein product [Mycena citricolor]|uniref:Uncharacterized protein n=1 Tax=Mycena citricolor TaxID=2018698 RepID=A0AAD2K5A6_9AGAR|nr:unnamed protein product [Mycena citricolor]